MFLFSLLSLHLFSLLSLFLFSLNRDHLYGRILLISIAVYDDIENRLLHVLRKMERRGVYVDRARLAEVKKAIEDLQMEVYQNIPLT